MGTDQMTPAECMKFARLAGELSVSGEALESCAATIARLTAELAKHQPEEMTGKCFCKVSPMPFTRKSGHWHCYKNGPWAHCKYCPECGAYLGSDGIARRNVTVDQITCVAYRDNDSERVRRVEAALVRLTDYWHEPCNPREEFTQGIVSQCVYAIENALDLTEDDCGE